jgi:hypothetical protein
MRTLFLLIISLMSLGSAARAATVFDNPWAGDQTGGHCQFSTACAAAVSAGNDFAAQAFTLTGSTNIRSASFTELDLGLLPSDAYWMFLNADGVGGTPGTIVSSGSSSILQSLTVGTYSGSYQVHQESFNVGKNGGVGPWYLLLRRASGFSILRHLSNSEHRY